MKYSTRLRENASKDKAFYHLQESLVINKVKN